jgi:hypothetical protein
VLFGSRTIAKSAYVVLKKDNHIQSIEFEVVQRRRFFGSLLGAASVGAMLGLLLQRAKSIRPHLPDKPCKVRAASLK